MLAFSRDKTWIARLERAASRGGWPFLTAGELPEPGKTTPFECSLVVLDRALAGSGLSTAVTGLRAAYPAAAIVLSCAEQELGSDGLNAALCSGVDETLSKSWDDERLHAKLSFVRDRALRGEARVSVDGALRAERRSRRVFARARKNWEDLRVPAPEFVLLWRLLAGEGREVSRAELLDALKTELGREVEAETVSRRILALRRLLAPWKGTLDSVRGGRYRLASSRRRSMT